MNRGAAGILHAPICGERRRAQAATATLAASEIFAGSTAGQTSFWLKSRARSGASRWEVGRKIEAFWFQVGASQPVQEGNMVLRVAS